MSKMCYKALVGYMSQTGNTRKVAEAIYTELPGEKTIAKISDLEDLDGFDVSFIGFPMIDMGPPSGVASFLLEKGKGKKIALFLTHGAALSFPPLKGWLQKCIDATDNAELLGLFSCQGEVNVEVREAMARSNDPQLQMYARMSVLADGQPDEENLSRARAFAKRIMEVV